jgi:ubiquinone/menaquinone biosynthesis C-methylase UbiE
MNRIHGWICSSNRWRRFVRGALVPQALEGTDLGNDVLEIGPGPGLTTDVLRARAPRLTALEFDSKLAAALHARMADGDVTVVEGDATAMPFADASFSAVVCFTMLHHVPTAELQDRVFSEARRVLRPGGVFTGSDSVVEGLVFKLIHIGDTMNLVDPATLRPRLAAAGFDAIEVRPRPRVWWRAVA